MTVHGHAKPRPVQAPARRRAPSGARRRTILLLGAAVALAAVAAGVLIAVSRTGSGSGFTSTSTLAGAAETNALLAGIPQHGRTLGSPQAPLTLVEYGDLQCPVCAEWAGQALPTIVARYVRTGRVRIEFRGLHFIGPDSEIALRAALAAAPFGRFWHVVDLLYRNQGEENRGAAGDGWVTESLLESAVASFGLDPQRVLAGRSTSAVDGALATADAQARADAVPGTPTFELRRGIGPLEPLRLTTFDPRELSALIDRALAE
ncbi:MAG TPA: thioredoxin domain-containing protein [Gaiellaceae bacterium]|nr:thioredoxin domain-containing protein [Gaiellaceae bacterium]